MFARQAFMPERLKTFEIVILTMENQTMV